MAAAPGDAGVQSTWMAFGPAVAAVTDPGIRGKRLRAQPAAIEEGGDADAVVADRGMVPPAIGIGLAGVEGDVVVVGGDVELGRPVEVEGEVVAGARGVPVPHDRLVAVHRRV